jgi:hypothetical protein
MICDMLENIYKIKDFINWDENLSFFDVFKKKLNLYLKMSGL